MTSPSSNVDFAVEEMEVQESNTSDRHSDKRIHPHRSHFENETRRWWNVFKKWKEGDENNWWFASTGIPLLAATLGPLANVSSIAALVTSWRQKNFFEDRYVSDFDGIPYADPRWCYWINVASLACGFLGNLFLLLNFTQRIRYIIALPATIVFWYLSTGFLVAILACMEIYVPPIRPYEGYTQGYWYGVAAAAFYLICSMLLMVNMLGYFLGHYPESFDLSDSQRTLILQTMAFFIWLGGGAAVFSKIERDAGEAGWKFADGLYFCDVTILTVGFGDLVPTTDLGRGLIFPFAVGGIIMLALVVTSLYKFMREMSDEKILKNHIERMRTKAVERTVTNSFDLRHREDDLALAQSRSRVLSRISAPVDPRPYRTAMGETVKSSGVAFPRLPNALKISRQPKIMLLREEKDRFDAMRQIQADTKKFKRWLALFWSVTTFSILWCVGAVVFWQAEKGAQGMTYFQALYFCYISLLTIGYGDMSPKSNPGRCFFVIWSLIAVPTMTILVSDLGDTVVAKFKKWSDGVADFTVLPKEGTWRAFLERHPWLLFWLQRRIAKHQANKRLRQGFDTTDPDSQPRASDKPMSPTIDDNDIEADLVRNPTIATLAAEAETDTFNTPSYSALSRQLAHAIQKVSLDLRLPKPKRYAYEDWVEFTRLIRLTTPEKLDRALGTITSRHDEDQNEEGLVNWDWIGNDSPLMSGESESQWLQGRLCESLIRLEKRREIFMEKVRDGRDGRWTVRMMTENDDEGSGEGAMVDAEKIESAPGKN